MIRRMIAGAVVLLVTGACSSNNPPPEIADAAARGPIGDPARGAMVFETCASCHTLDPTSGEPYFGPHLADLFGRPLAADPGYDYSEALRTRGGVWTEERLASYLRAPRDFAPGTTMVQAMPDSQDVADIIAYMKRELGTED